MQLNDIMLPSKLGISILKSLETCAFDILFKKFQIFSRLQEFASDLLHNSLAASVI